MKSIYEKELIAICLAVQKWKHYLMGRHFSIRTDQQSLRFIMQQQEVGANYQKWVCKLMGFDFDISYKPGPSNRVADALSRKTDGEVVLNTLVTSSIIDWDLLYKEVDTDPFLTRLKTDIITGNGEYTGFIVFSGRLLYKQRVVIPKALSFIPHLLREYHDSPVGGILGMLKRTYAWQQSGFGRE